MLLAVRESLTAAQWSELLEVYQRSLQSDPLIREAEANRRATEEAIPQARGLLLPQVATDYGWDRETFLAHTCRKADLDRDRC